MNFFFFFKVLGYWNVDFSPFGIVEGKENKEPVGGEEDQVKCKWKYPPWPPSGVRQFLGSLQVEADLGFPALITI